MRRISPSGPALLACALVLTGCLTTRSDGDRYFEAGAYAKAAEAYKAEIASGELVADRDRALYNLALSCFIRSTPGYDLETSRGAFERLIREFPQSRYTPPARAILEWVEKSVSLEARLDRELESSRDLQARVKALERHLAEANAATRETDGLMARLYPQIDDQKRRLQALRSDLAASQRQVKKLTGELEEIKKMDLAEPP